jgi:bifunctional ADP-heptose synthase (sugar kinase/adenylyltransferase)
MKILVIGDSCIDKFIYCDIERICPEAPVPVLKPKDSKSNPGMASNVVENLKSLGAEVDIITNDNTIIKTRYVDTRSGQMVIRVDKNDQCKRYHGETYDAVDYDAIIISDYCKGFLTEDDIEAWAERATCPVFLDTKKQLGKWCEDIDFIKINEFEHKKNFERLPDYPFILNKMIVTIGSKGCKYKDEIFPVPGVSVKDVSGAGDTFLAALVLSYLKNNDIKSAITFANECATKVVQKRGVAII